MDDGLRIPLAVLRRRADPRLVRRTVDLDDLHVGEVAVAGGRVEVDLEAEARGPDVVVVGAVRATWLGACRRCLGDVGGDLDLRVHEVLSAGSDQSAGHDVGSDRGGDPAGESGDVYPLAGDEADLEPVVRDAVLLALPLSPLCVEDCAGPDPDRFPTAVATGPEDAVRHDEPTLDPRWAALDVLREPEATGSPEAPGTSAE